MKNKLIILQEETSDCGVCCLLSIMRYYNFNISLEQLRYETATNKLGVTAYDLIECAKDHMFDSYAEKNNIIKKNLLPCIAHIKINEYTYHFIVIYKITSHHIIVMDPSYGIKKYTIEEFNKIFNNIIIYLEPRTKLSYKTNYYKKIINIKNYINVLIKILILYFITAFLTLILSYITPLIYNYKNIFIIYILSATILFKNIFNFIYSIIYEKLIIKIKSDAFLNFVKHIFYLPLNYIHGKDYGEIIKRVEDLSDISDLYSNSLFTIITNLILFIISIIILFINLKLLSLLILIIYIILTIICFYLYRHNNKNLNTLINNNTLYKSNLINNIKAISSIKYNTVESYYISSLNRHYNNSLNSNYKFTKNINIISLLKNIIINLIELLIITYYIFNNTNLEYLYFFIALINITNNSVSNIIDILPSIIYIQRIRNKINDYYSLNEDNNINSKFENGIIAINNLNYKYKNTNIFNNFNCVIKPKEKVLIKGNTGKGKTTLCKLLIRENIIGNNIIKINNKDINLIDIHDLRSNVVYSGQNEVIINGTIEENILLNRKINKNELQNILTSIQFDKILKKYNFGLNTYLFEENCMLSGGEKQLLFLARALVSNPCILILDETLSEVNQNLEYEIMKNICNLYKNSTIIYVTHKNNIDFFDKTITV